MEILRIYTGELKNENKSLKNENKALKDEIETIKLDIIENQKSICELERKEKNNNDEIVELNEEMMMLKNENRNLKVEIERIKLDKTNRNLDNTIETIIINADELASDIDEIKIRMKIMENQYKEFMKESDKNFPQNSQLTNKSNDFSEMIKSKEYFERTILETQGTFEWKIDAILDLQDRDQIYSKVFDAFPNGYRMCLSTVINRNTKIYLKIFLHLMQGENDYTLHWPCKCDVIIDVINQNNNLINKRKTIKYSNRENINNDSGWNKPINKRNNGILFLSLSIDDIVYNLKNDQLLIKCRTNIPPPTKSIT